MAKEQKARAADENPSRGQDEGGSGMNTGVAIIGFVVCFVAGAGLMWGYDAHNGVSKRPVSAGRVRQAPHRSTSGRHS